MKEGATASLMVEVKDAEEIYFTRDGDVIEDVDRYIISTQDNRHYLEICDVESEDEGEYTVICTNQYGHVSSTAQLLVAGRLSALLLCL